MAQYPNLAFVASYFPDFEKWLERAGSPSRYMQEAESELAKLPSLAIERACKKLMRDEMPRAAKLPFEVARVARRIAAAMDARKWQRLTEGESTVACKLCDDTGYVNILDPGTVACVLQTGKLPAFPYEAVVACKCPKGQLILERNRMAAPEHRRNIAQYDEHRHILREIGTLPMDQYRSLLGGETKSLRLKGGPREIVNELADRTRIEF